MAKYLMSVFGPDSDYDTDTYGYASQEEMQQSFADTEGIDEVYFEVAKIDGAGWWQQLRYIILPFIRGPLTTIILVTAISSFQVFDLIFALTNGGPGRATIVLPLYMLTSAFTFHKIGYGAAIAVVLSLVILSFSLVLLRVRGSLKESEIA